MKNKKESQLIHVQRRARERLDLYLNENQIKELVISIQKNKFTFLERQSNTITLWKTIIEEIECVLVYNSQTKQLSTIYPYSWWLERGGQYVIRAS